MWLKKLIIQQSTLKENVVIVVSSFQLALRILLDAKNITEKMKGYSTTEELYDDILENWFVEDLIQAKGDEDTEMILEYLQLDESFWSWDRIFDTLSSFTGGQDHKLKFLEPRVDFFTRHPSQFAQDEAAE